MAKHRLFSIDIVDTDVFLEMPASAQCLYFHLGMRADDDGFVSSPKRIARLVNCSEDDLKILITKQFIIPFESGVVVIRDWNVNNTIKKDRYKPTLYTEEKKLLKLNENRRYSLLENLRSANGDSLETFWSANGDSLETFWSANGDSLEPQYKLSKDKLSKDKLNKKTAAAEERACAREEISSSEEPDKGMIVVEYYRKLTGHDVTPNRLQLIDGYISDGAEPELICALLDYAVESNVRNVWQYTETALMSCMDRGIYTLAAYREEQEQRKQERGRTNGQTTVMAEFNTGGSAEENHDPRFGIWV